MGISCTQNPSEEQRRKKAEEILAAREKFVSKRDGAWRDINCDANCPGWAVFETDRGFGVQACDDCNHTAKQYHLPTLLDSYAKTLPAAQRELRRHVHEYGSARRATENPRSVLTGQSWDTARQKLRGAAVGTRKNPPRGELAIVREFMKLLRDPDPKAMTIAEDLLLENGISLATAGQWIRPRYDEGTGDLMGGEFILDSPNTIAFYTEPLKHLGPRDGYDDSASEPHPDTTNSGWVIEESAAVPRRSSVYVVTLVYVYEGKRDKILSGSYYTKIEHAQKAAAADAWMVAKALKQLLWEGVSATNQNRIRDAVMAAYSGVGPSRPAEAPPELFGFAVRGNPSVPKEATDKYEEFHRYKPVEIGEFGKRFEIPRSMLRAGTAKWTTYRSSKVDPSTLEKPRRPVNYIHEHEAGVMVYLPINNANADLLDNVATSVTVPSEFRKVDALVKLGDSLGYCFVLPNTANDDDDEVEAEATAPLPELYCTPDGKCLLVIQDKSEVLAMIWGGGLGVFARGIDG